MVYLMQGSCGGSGCKPARAARLELVDGVIHVDPKPAFVRRHARWLGTAAADPVPEARGDDQPAGHSGPARLAEFTNAYPWEWTPSNAEAFFIHLRSSNGGKLIEVSTGRGYKQTLTLFMEYITDPRYGWPEECLERSVKFPQQIFHGDNSVIHASEYEEGPGAVRSPMTRYSRCSTRWMRESTRRGSAAARAPLPPCGTRLSSKRSTPSGCGGTRRGCQTWRTCGAPRSPRSTGSMAGCSSATASRPRAARPSGAPCSPPRRWTGPSTCSTVGNGHPPAVLWNAQAQRWPRPGVDFSRHADAVQGPAGA